MASLRRVRWRRPIGWLAACLACAACGGAVHQAASTGTSGGGSVTFPTQAPTDGAHIFAHDCQACHSLVGNESQHKQGGDLLGYRMTRSQLIGFTRVMPTRRLSSVELSAVADYILRMQRRHAR